MKSSYFVLLFFIVVSSSVAGEWPVYQPAEIISTRDPGNSNGAIIKTNRIIVNDIVNCVFESWTIEVVSSKSFEFWRNSQPQMKQIGQMKQEFESSMGYIKLLCKEKITGENGTWIFALEKPEPGDKFYISVTSNGDQAGKLSGGYCDFTGAVPVWHNYHSGIDIGEVENLADPTPTPAPGDPTPIPGTVCHIYPVRSGEIVRIRLLAGGDKAVIVRNSPGVYDWYSHVQHDVFDVGDYSANPIQVDAGGIFATRLSSLVFHQYPHLHFGIYSDDQATEPAGTKSIKNPLNGLVPGNEFPVTPPAVIDLPSVEGICFRADDHGLPTPLPTPFTLSTIRGDIDIEAKMLDYNGATTHPMGVNQIGYHLYSGYGPEMRFGESRIFMDENVFCGEPGQNEYSPYHFNEYGLNRVEFQTLYGRGPFPSVLMHNYYYILTNNQDLSGGKAGFSTEGSWNTEETILTPAGDAAKYPDGPYTVLVRGTDIFGNWSDDSDPVNSRAITVLNNFDHVLYVDDDSKLPGDLDDPFSSITEAMNYSGWGTLVVVAPGTYDSSRESFPIDIPEGTTVMGSGHEYSFVQGNGYSSVFRGTQNDAVLSGFTISGGGSDPNDATVVIDNSSVKVRDCLLSGNGYTGTGLLFFWSIPGASAENCIIQNHTEQGIWCDHSNNSKVVNCIIRNNGLRGVNAEPSAWVDIANCIILHCYDGVRAWFNSHIDVYNTDFWMNDWIYHYYDSTINLTSCFESDPDFVSAHGRSYYLDYSSRCVNQGNDFFVENPQIYLRTTREDNYCDPGTGLYDVDAVDLGYHYDPIISTPTPFPTNVPTDTPAPTNTPTPTPTTVPGLGTVYFDSPDYFTEGDTAEIFVWDSDLNTNPSVAESYDVDVTSDTIYPSTIPMTVTEISVDSEYFTTSSAGTDLGFTYGASVPYSLIQVSDSDIVTVIYDDASPAGQRTDTAIWYSAVPPTETPFPTTTPTVTPTITETPTTTPTAHPGTFYEDFESGASGWVATGLWHLTTKLYNSSSHSMWYADDDLEHYDTGGPNSGTLTSPPIQLEAGYTTLTFWSREETDGTRYWDTRKVYITNDAGASWDLLFQSYNDDDSWYQTRAVDLSDYVGDIIRIRFKFDTVDDGDNQHLGWLIDDIAIDDSPLPLPSTGIAGKLLLLIIFFFLMAVYGRRSVSRVGSK
jgi:hypothetical protein